MAKDVINANNMKDRNIEHSDNWATPITLAFIKYYQNIK